MYIYVNISVSRLVNKTFIFRWLNNFFQKVYLPSLSRKSDGHSVFWGSIRHQSQSKSPPPQISQNCLKIFPIQNLKKNCMIDLIFFPYNVYFVHCVFVVMRYLGILNTSF